MQQYLQSKSDPNTHTIIDDAVIQTNTPEVFTHEPESKSKNADFLVACGAFHKGAAKPNLSLAQSLFLQGIDINWLDQDDWSALFHASGEGHLKIVEWLVQECSANVNLCSSAENCTALWVACYNGRRDVAQVAAMQI